MDEQYRREDFVKVISELDLLPKKPEPTTRVNIQKIEKYVTDGSLEEILNGRGGEGYKNLLKK